MMWKTGEPSQHVAQLELGEQGEPGESYTRKNFLWIFDYSTDVEMLARLKFGRK